jgi:hypothetical protein
MKGPLALTFQLFVKDFLLVCNFTITILPEPMSIVSWLGRICLLIEGTVLKRLREIMSGIKTSFKFFEVNNGNVSEELSPVL